ncbi:MAG: DRTGG domain-containing protein [Eubacteriales bacterium]|nr:DRTGG domain-containing protein [Eubacteriales bacterium]
MTILGIIKILDARVLCGEPEELTQEVSTACGSDLMSDVLAFVKGKTILITGLTNVHVIRTAEMLDIHCIVFARGKVPGDDVLAEAREVGIVVLTTKHTTYTTCGLLYEAGIRGNNERATIAE